MPKKDKKKKIETVELEHLEPEMADQDLSFKERLPESQELAIAEGIHNLSDPTTENAVLANSHVGLNYIPKKAFWRVQESRLDKLVPIPNGFSRPIYDPSFVHTEMCDIYDRQSCARDGKGREGMITVLSNIMNMGMPQMGFQHVKEPLDLHKGHRGNQ